jgi:hypothetical protein
MSFRSVADLALQYVTVDESLGKVLLRGNLPELEGGGMVDSVSSMSLHLFPEMNSPT